MFSPEDILLILVVAFFLFGANKLPEMARSLGKAAGEFKKAQMESDIELKHLDRPLSDDTDIKIRNIAMEMGINIENKTSDQIIEELRSKIRNEKKYLKEI